MEQIKDLTPEAIKCTGEASEGCIPETLPNFLSTLLTAGTGCTHLTEPETPRFISFPKA